MPDRGRRGHGGAAGPPPWWPRDEGWPPTRTDAWHGARRYFLRRLVVVVAILFVVLFGASALAISLFVRAGRGGGSVGAVATGGVIVLLVVVALVARGVRRMAAPIADVMDAADRVAAGDYAVRVDVHGPREIRRLMHAFNQMAERLQGSERQRRELLADVAHELRTPLTVIRGNAEAMVDGLYRMDREHLSTIVEETDQMGRLLEDLSTLSTAEAGQLTLHRSPTLPGDLLADVLAAFAPGATASGVRLLTDTGEGLPFVDLDPVRIREVLANLVTNALRHTPAGGTVTVRARSIDEGVRFEVHDTGTGIAPELLPDVFGRFRRTPGSPGVGLGLAIARSLVEAHGGEIGAQSIPGDTTLWFTLAV